MSDVRMRQPVYAPVDFLIITALPEEREALLGLLANVTKSQFNGCPTYYLSTIPAYGRDGNYTIAVTMLSQMGNVEAAQHTSQAIKDLNPDYVLMTGIAGGVKGKVGLGDVVVATQVWYYEQAKQCSEGLERRHQAYPVDHLLLDRAQNYNDTAWRSLVSTPRRGFDSLKLVTFTL